MKMNNDENHPEHNPVNLEHAQVVFGILAVVAIVFLAWKGYKALTRTSIGLIAPTAPDLSPSLSVSRVAELLDT